MYGIYSLCIYIINSNSNSNSSIALVIIILLVILIGLLTSFVILVRNIVIYYSRSLPIVNNISINNISSNDISSNDISINDISINDIPINNMQAQLVLVISNPDNTLNIASKYRI